MKVLKPVLFVVLSGIIVFLGAYFSFKQDEKKCPEGQHWMKTNGGFCMKNIDMPGHPEYIAPEDRKIEVKELPPVGKE